MPSSPAARAFIEQLKAAIPGMLDWNELAAAITPEMRAASQARVTADLRDAIAGQIAQTLADRHTTSELAALRDKVLVGADLPNVVVDTLVSAVTEAMHKVMAKSAMNTSARDVDLDQMLSVPQLCRRYHMGRKQILEMITDKRLPAVPRIVRGGREGYMVAASVAAAVLGGVRQ